jgi:cephalosporin hydroxylase
MKSVDEFHQWYEKSRTWEQTTWLGVPCWKLPFDAFVMQELIYKIKPDYIIETGTGCGGSAVFYASILHLIGHGRVITNDIDNKKHQWYNCKNVDVLSRITFVLGNSTDKETVDTVHKFCKEDATNMVILDSWHTYEHVSKELELYHGLVSRGSYLIVEDTHVDGHPVEWEYDDRGPYGAVEDFLKKHQNFEADQECEKHLMTFNPHGFLRRTK